MCDLSYFAFDLSDKIIENGVLLIAGKSRKGEKF